MLKYLRDKTLWSLYAAGIVLGTLFVSKGGVGFIYYLPLDHFNALFIEQDLGYTLAPSSNGSRWYGPDSLDTLSYLCLFCLGIQ